ncbi:hypothetical protein C0992_004814 [Termitomyces sp. T32_za158]|nr:hypothetical protein C0992_004814 [Termitomyces sp. T32_za158]
MPGTLSPETPHHIPPPPTKENLDFADLAIIDFTKFGTPEGKSQLVQDVRNAMNTVGFFYVINHGYTQEQTRRIFDIAEIPFRVSDEEKQNYPRSLDDEIKTKNVWLKGHTDFGSLSLLWSQPVSALQILDPQGNWKWVKHIDNALVRV